MSRLLSLFQQVIREKKGIVSIEAAILLLVFAGISALLVDLGTSFLFQSRLERAAYTTASVLRERTAIYKDPLDNNINKPVTQAQVTELRSFINILMNNDDLVVVVEELQFALAIVKPADPGKPTYSRLASPENARCETQLDDFTKDAKLSPWSIKGRWLPLYRVSVCVPGKASWFKALTSPESGLIKTSETMAFNIVIPR